MRPVMPWQEQWGRRTTLRPIVRPGASPLVRHFSPGLTSFSIQAFLMAVAAVTLAAVMAVVFFPVGMWVGALGLVAVIAVGVHSYGRDVVGAPHWGIEGRAIEGEAFSLLEDIDQRFAYAESNIRRLPTGIVWPEVEADVSALLWEAAEHGAHVTALDAEIHELRYAQDGTPQAALKRSVEEERARHWDIMRGVQWEAELLARTAGNAAAAARVALARAGSLAALKQITPSRRAIVAAGALAEARSRLELLAEVWAELDDSGAVAAEKLAADRRRQLGTGE